MKTEKIIRKAQSIINSGFSPSATKKGSGRKHCHGLTKKIKEILSNPRVF